MTQANRFSKPRFALLVLMGAYPVITAILYVIAPLTGAWALWQRTLLVAPMMVSAMIWGVIPFVQARFRGFINPAAKLSSRVGEVSRGVLAVVATMGILLSSPRTAEAQAGVQNAKTWDFRLTSGGLIATGDQKDFLKNAQVSAAQLSWLVRPSFAVTGTFSWARSRDLNSLDSPKLDVFTSDLGVEVRPAQWFAGRMVRVNPFAGFGGGVRSYNYRKLDEDATHNLAGYGTVGADIGVGRVGLRLEARNYVTGFNPLVGSGRSDTRNDVVITAALSLKKHRAPQN